MNTVNEGDIIQITDESNKWFPCLLIVDEVASWGVQAYVIIPQEEGKPPANAYYRVQHGQFEVVGAASVMSA